jgi:hypothetical protein
MHSGPWGWEIRPLKGDFNILGWPKVSTGHEAKWRLTQQASGFEQDPAFTAKFKTELNPPYDESEIIGLFRRKSVNLFRNSLI